MNSDIKKQICKEDFYFMMRNAVIQAGGTDNLAKWKTMKLEELVNLFAQNGLRMIYMPEKQMDSIEIVWEDPRSNNVPFTPPNQPYRREDGPLPKKKQLLCDSLDNGEDESNPEY